MKTEIKPPASAVEAYIFANTPSYLFKKLIADAFVSKLQSEGESVLIDVVESTQAGDAESIVAAYAAALALLKQGVSDTRIIGLKNTALLVWLKHIISLYKETIPRGTQVTIKFPQLNPQGNECARTAPTTFTKITHGS
jgi:hypothetical protein